MYGNEGYATRLVAPLPVRPTPAEAEGGVDPALDSRGGVPEGGDVRDQPDVEEDGADREVRGDGEDVPQEGRPEVRPEEPVVGIGDQPVGQPHPAEVNDGEEAGGKDRKSVV